MCRLLLGRITGGSDLGEYVDSLLRVSRSDPLITWRKNRRHSDGWGYAYLSGDITHEYHSSKPVYNDEAGVKQLERILRGQGGYILIHVRKASTDQPLGILHTHPYRFDGKGGITFWIAFNGSGPRITGMMRTDAYSIGLTLLGSCGNLMDPGEFQECMLDKYSKIIDSGAIMSGGNLAFLYTDGTNTGLCFYPVYKAKNNKVREYYKHYLIRVNGSELIASSSIIVDLRLENNSKILEEGKPTCIKP